MCEVCSPQIIQDGCYTALGVASRTGHTKVVMTLINKGANVNYEDKVAIVLLFKH